MTHEQKADEIKTLLLTLTGVGVVHNRSRAVMHWGKYTELFKTGNPAAINGWEITRTGPVEYSDDYADIIEFFVLRHVRGLNDAGATDLVFQEHVNAAVRKFRDTPQLTFGALPRGLRVVEIDERLFGDTLCHFAECHLEVVQEYDTF